MNDKLYIISFFVICALTFVIAFGIKPYFEMKTFNKFSTDKKASFVDAVFAELRIEGCR